MTDYTPTTDEVREAYIWDEEDYAAEFDRWLAAHDKEVIEAFIDMLWTLIDKRTMQEDHRCVDGELSMECDAHRGYDKAINEVRNAIKSARRAAIRGEGEHA
jgi:hypothetical protein